MTRFKNILKRTKRDDEKLTLLKAEYIEEENPQKDELGFVKNDLGFSKIKYIPVQTLQGIIQEPQHLDIDFKGQESNPAYVAYLMPTFDIEASNLNNYRIKYERPYETMILKIVSYDPNLFLRHKRHHVEIHLVLEKKYVE